MTTQAASLNDIDWTKATSENNVSYEIGVLKPGSSLPEGVPAEASLEPEANLVTAALPTGWVTVHWHWVVGTHEWISVTDLAVRATGITAYRLYYNGVPNIFDYTLEVFTTRSSVDYFFKDEEPDTYKCWVASCGIHSIKYNSSKPTIVSVKAEFA